MPMYDFRCSGCGVEFEAISHFDSETQHVEPVAHSCGELGARIWRNAPGLRSSEKLPSELKQAMKRNYGIDVDTRDEHDKVCARLGVVPDYASFEATMKAAQAVPDDDEIELTPEELEASREAALETYERAEAGTLPMPETVDGSELAVAGAVLPTVD